MKLLDHIKELEYSAPTVVVTLGYFDGMHLGHQQLFKVLNQVKSDQGRSIVISFDNHPSTVLSPLNPTPLINTNDHRISLIKAQKVDALFFLPFTREFKEISADDFISEIYENLNFTDLVIGPDTTIGKDKSGDYELLSLLSKKYAFNLHKVDFLKKGPTTISSTLIRKMITEGKLEEVSELLGRPYSIYAPVAEGMQKGSQIGFPTMNFEIDELCTPPCGVYKVWVTHNDQRSLGIANLGYAPSVKQRTSPVLEVHLLEGEAPKYDDMIEVAFDRFIRTEMKFHSLDELKTQIQRDIDQVKA